MNMGILVHSILLVNSMRLIIYLSLLVSTIFYTEPVVPLFIPVGAVEAPALLGGNIDSVIEMFVHDTTEADKVTITNWHTIDGLINPVSFILSAAMMQPGNIVFFRHWSFVIVTVVVALQNGALWLCSWLVNAIFVSGANGQQPAPVAVCQLPENQRPIVNGIQLAYCFFHPDNNPQLNSHSERAICEFFQQIQPQLPIAGVVGIIVHIFNQRRACLWCYHSICNYPVNAQNIPVTVCIRHYSQTGRSVVDIIKK